MLYYIKKYPFSLLVVMAVVYLSFFNPSDVDSDLFKIPHIDKIVHFCMYGGVSGMLWLEYLWGHRTYRSPMWHAWIGATLCPLMFSAAIELLQEELTTHRGGDWLDFVANAAGIFFATLLGRYVLSKWIYR